MQFNQDFKYALVALEYLRYKELPVSASSIANANNLSVAFLDQILRKLRIAGIVTVKRGPGGGFKRTRVNTATEVYSALGYSLTDTHMTPVHEALMGRMHLVFKSTLV